MRTLAKHAPLPLLAIAAVAGLVYSGFLRSGDRSSKIQEPGPYVIELAADGFSPSQITVPVGATVTFRTVRGQPFWPASDIHPTHEILPEFDPRTPLPPETEWQFRFERAGVWNFHDHLDPRSKGRIIVRDEHEGLASVFSPRARPRAAPCTPRAPETKEEQSSLIGCWDTYLQDETLAEGTAAALSAFARLYDQDPFFRVHCHRHAHTIGLEAYWQFAQGEPFSLTPTTTLCGYGFFHGFMQELVSHARDFDQARALCQTAEDAFPRSAERCYHGIGHGLVYLHAGELWDQVERIVERSLADCETFVPERYRYDCRFGVFGGVESFYYGQHGFKLEVRRKDPFWLCRGQPEAVRPICYDAFVPFVYAALGREATIAFLEAEAVGGGTQARQAMKHLGLVIHKYERGLDATNDAAFIALCASLSRPLNLACFEGFAGGFVQYEKIGSAHQRAYAFCASPSLTEEERRACFFGAMEMAVYLSGREEARRVCREAPAAYRELCAERFRAIWGSE